MAIDDILFNQFVGPATVFKFSKDTVTTIKINDRYLPELGMNMDVNEFMEVPLCEAFDEENLQIFIDAIRECIVTGEEVHCETWRKHISNCCGEEKIRIQSRLIPIESNCGEDIIFEEIRNVTAEKKDIDKLTESERRFKIASDQINIYYWEYTVATKEMRPCFRCMRDLGLPALVKNYPEPAIEMGIFPPDYADMYRDWHRQIAEGVKELEADIPLTVGRVPFKVRYTTEFDENGKPVKAYGSATLIPEKDINKEKLRKQIIGTLSENYDSILLADLETDTFECIKEAPGFPFPKSTVFSECVNYFFNGFKDENGEDPAERFGDFDYIKNELFKDSLNREFLMQNEMARIWIRLGFQVVEMSSNGVSKILITSKVFDDVQVRKIEADRLIAEQKNELEKREGQLIEAVDAANKANSAKTSFFFNMSHDIRTPMNAIMGFSRLALEEIDNRENTVSYLEKIVASSEHMLGLINDILDMSRIESGKMELVKTSASLKALCNEAYDIIKTQMQEKNIEFSLDTSHIEDDGILCDKLRFKQILLNLLSNAYKFTPEGGKVSFSVSEIKRGESPEFEIRIKDTGIGMTAEFKEHIWEPFSREKSEAVNVIQGTGLGMSIVRNLVNLMQGTIDLTTELGKGTEFVINLPLERSAQKAEESKQKYDVSDLRFDGRKILLVDDTSVNRILAKAVLSKIGFEIVEAENGFEAVKKVSESAPGEFDLVLMDVMMPVMDGLEAARKIRELPDKIVARIPIIAMTANAFEEDVKATLDAGMNAHVTKPFIKEELIFRINECLGEKRIGDGCEK